MATVKAILLKPLDGDAEGATREFDQHDFNVLKGMGAVKAAPTHENKAERTPANKAKA